MSYLQNTSGTPSFSEAVISFWFRVPKETLAKVKYDYQADPSPVFNGILPLLVLGQEGINEGEYTPNASPALYYVTDFTGSGPIYQTSLDIVYECTGTWIFSLAGYVANCCATATFTSTYTATQIGYSDDYYKETYSVVYAPTYTEQPANPTCIGVTADGYLYVNFQTAQQPTVTGQEPDEYDVAITPGENIWVSGVSGYQSGVSISNITYYQNALGCTGLIQTETVDDSNLTTVPASSGSGHVTTPEVTTKAFPVLPFETGKFYSGGYDGSGNNNIKVSPDKWHHVLVSVKLQDTKTHNVPYDDPSYGYDGGSLLYIALDDVNYTKDDLSGIWGWGGAEGQLLPNEVYPDQAWDIATRYYDPERGPPVTYALSSPQVPGGAIGIPAPVKYVDNIRQVEMAELQIWLGQSMDTGKQDKRRLFIDADGKPVKPETAEAKLGKPQILLHGSSNWKRGIIKGTLAPASNTSAEPEPWFTPTPPTDGINTWKPDPSLHGPQSPNEKPKSPAV